MMKRLQLIQFPICPDGAPHQLPFTLAVEKLAGLPAILASSLQNGHQRLDHVVQLSKALLSLAGLSPWTTARSRSRRTDS
jgi:hypothetical protein